MSQCHKSLSKSQRNVLKRIKSAGSLEYSDNLCHVFDVLEDLGLIEYDDGKYRLTQSGINQL